MVDRAWEGETVVCIAGGPYLSETDLALVEGRFPAIAVNDAYLVAPWADVVYFADHRWWKWHTDGIAKRFAWANFSKEEQRAAFAAFKGQKCTIENTGMMISDPEVFMLHNLGSEGLCEKPNGLHTGSNSGYQAMNIAYLAGAKRILMLAYDMRFAGRSTHAHDGHPHKHPEDVYSGYARNFKTMLPQLTRAGVEVINCTPGSRIDAFPIRSLASILGGA